MNNWIEDLGQDYEILPETHPPMYLMHKYWARKPANIVSSYIQKYSKIGDIVLDPFMGSGVTIIEANILGRKAIGCDINPVACFIAEQNGRDIDVNLLQDAFDFLKDQIMNNPPFIFQQLYTIECPQCKNDAYITHLIWENSKYLQKKENPGNTKKKNTLLEMRINCIKCKNQIFTKDSNNPVYSEIAKFLDDREKLAYKIAKEINISMPNVLFQYNSSQNFLQLRHSLRENPQIDQLFSPVNLIFLSFLKQKIDNIPEKFETVKKTLLFCFTSSLGQASNMVWVIDARKGKKLARTQVGSWTHHFFWDPSKFFEINAWDSFIERYKKCKAGFRNLLKRKEENNSFQFKLAENFQQLSTTNPVIIANNNIQKLQLPENSVDFIFTDPPYGDSIQYGELNALWAGFLGFNMEDYIEKISKNEVVMNTRQQKGIKEYKLGLKHVFSELYRILKQGRIMIITFHNTSFEIRNTLIEAVIESGFELKQILHQMPPRIPIKSLLHAEGSPMGDYYIRFIKPENEQVSKGLTQKSADIIKNRNHIKQIIDEILIKRGEPTAELWIMNFIDTYLFREKLIPLQNFSHYIHDLRNSNDFVIVDKYKWWFSQITDNLIIERPLTDRIKEFIQKYLKNRPLKGNGNKMTFSQEIYNELYKEFRGIYTPDKIEVNRLIDQLINEKGNVNK